MALRGVWPLLEYVTPRSQTGICHTAESDHCGNMSHRGIRPLWEYVTPRSEITPRIWHYAESDLLWNNVELFEETGHTRMSHSAASNSEHFSTNHIKKMRRDSYSSKSACCKAGPSSNLGSAPQKRLSTERKQGGQQEGTRRETLYVYSM